MSDNDPRDEQMRKDSIDFFISLVKYKIESKKSSRPSNFGGHIGRHMRKDLRDWFLNKYPNPPDFVKFFHENNHIFKYDGNTGDILLKTPQKRSERSKQPKPDPLVCQTNSHNQTINTSTVKINNSCNNQLDECCHHYSQMMDENPKISVIEFRKLTEDHKLCLLLTMIGNLHTEFKARFARMTTTDAIIQTLSTGCVHPRHNSQPFGDN
ncbi:uncharacterized protein LOC128960981 [Oppia nitens]|uniref:uncharacterized protein LOC128960981 n=1 Tax=Oppia nitens TaxID=1686743 RepID=UPI0023DA820D|nr:uncharacterized protein LOC128960981 [Oppia nitens]